MRSLRLVLILGGVALVVALVVLANLPQPAEPELSEGSASLQPALRRRSPDASPRAERLGASQAQAADQGRQLREAVPDVPSELAGVFVGGGAHGAFGRERLAALCDAGRFCGACATDADCPAGTGCSVSMRGKTVVAECLSSECTTDADCSGGRSCRIASLRGAASQRIGRCNEPGVVQLGGACALYGADPGATCSAGLSCRYFRCVPICDGTTACPAGSHCAEGACNPRCASDAECPKGESCIPVGEDAVCRPTDTESCFSESPCEGAKSACVVQVNAYRADFYCARGCSPADPCRPGYVCAAPVGFSPATSVCYRACQAQSDCGEGQGCSLVDQEQSLFGCVPRL